MMKDANKSYKLEIKYILFCFFLSTVSYASEQDFSGHVKLYPVYHKFQLQSLDDQNKIEISALQSQLRGNYFQTWEKSIPIKLKIETEFIQINSNKKGPEQGMYLIPNNSFRIFLENKILEENHEKNHSLSLNLDRLNMEINFNSFDLKIGRQTFNYGIARFIKASDVFIPFAPGTIDTEYRLGIDGIKLLVPSSETSELEFSIIFNKEDNEKIAAYPLIRALFLISNIENQLILTQFFDASMFAFMSQFQVADLGFWFEASEIKSAQEKKSYQRASIGAEYQFPNEYIAAIELHHNSSGAKEQAHYLSQYRKFAYQKGGVWLLAKNYFSLTLSKQVSALYNANLTAMNNLLDASSLAIFNMEYSASDNAYLLLTIMDSFYWASDNPMLTEFKNYPQRVSLGIRYYW